MDERRFDDFARAFGRTLTRRGLTRTGVGGTLAAVAGALTAAVGGARSQNRDRRDEDDDPRPSDEPGGPQSEGRRGNGGKGKKKAKCRKPGTSCKRGQKCCGGACKKSTCVCKRGRRQCGKRCIARTACCTAGKPGCRGGETCTNGVCEGTAPCTPKTRADCPANSCGPIDNDCGGTVDCSDTCGANLTCNTQTGQCEAACTPKTRDDCPANFCGSLDDGCGGTVNCGDTCGANRSCCGSACVNTRTDPNHCGACNTPCEPGSGCGDGICTPDCTPRTCDQQGLVCGPATDLCGTSIQCPECPNERPICDGGARCVECLNDGQCPTGRPFCSGARCVECTADAQCTAGGACQTGTCANGTCSYEQKAEGTACGAGADSGVCCGGTCGAGKQCCSDAQCGGNTPFCSAGSCVECTADAQCDQFANSACDEASGRCVCSPNAACPAGQTCGNADDGCGSTIPCGECTEFPNSTCGTDGRCTCTPNTACPAGRVCGTADDGCGDLLPCGECTAFPNSACDDVNGVCVCTPEAACPAGRICGSADDRCGGTVPCGDCPTARPNCVDDGARCVECTGNTQCTSFPNSTCDTGSGACVCTPNTACPEGRLCGTADDGCGGSIPCGECTEFPNSACDAATGTCTCSPNATCPAGQQCGAADDGCGDTITCGDCPTRECNSVACDGTTCVYTPADKGTPCGANNAGVCLNGACQQLSNNTAACNTADACGALPLVFCGSAESPDSCVCYSTIEGGGMCVRRAPGCQANTDPSGCQNYCPATSLSVDEGGRPECNTSDECADPDAVCVRLDQDPNAQPNCCGGSRTKRGFCVNKSARCASTCQPEPNPCGTRTCGTVLDSCDNTVTCGTCPTGQTCSQATGQCLSDGTTCAGCVDATGACRTEHTSQACGLGGAPCATCPAGQYCVSGECTCTSLSCNQGCCVGNVCDNTKRICGDTCISKEQCCHDGDRVPGCRPNETCAFNNSTGYAECRCGNGGRCQTNQGCCEEGANGPTCNANLRPCGDICIDKTQCCNDGQVGCEDGVACTTNECVPATGTGQTTPPGICQTTFTTRVCAEACAADEGYGNGYPFNKEVRCGERGSVNDLPCYCWRTTEGANACTEDFYTAPECRSTADCPADTVCIRTGETVGTGKHRCAPVCR